MSAEHALFDAYREWYRLAKAGHTAIAKEDWNFLLKCQNLTRGIQASIANLTQQARREWTRKKLDARAKEDQLRTLILELMDLLESNKRLLQAARTATSSRREKLQQAGQNLKRLRNSYALARPAVWTSFS